MIAVPKRMFGQIVRFLAWAALATVVAACTLFCWQLPTRALGLQARAVGPGALRITWNRTSAPVMLATDAAVEIDDGGSVQKITLSGDELRRGSIVYERQSPSVRVRLRVDQGASWARLAPTEASLWFAAPPPKPVVPTETATPPMALETDANTASREVTSEPSPALPAQTTPVRREARIPDIVLAAHIGPVFPQIPAAPPLSLPTAMQPLTAPLPVAAPVLPPALPSKTYAGPRSGRIIWTGSMARRGVVEIERAHASIGSLSGGLPGVPVNLRISPADLSSEGMVVYTPDPAANGRQEPASAANGWNRTLFRWQPDRAHELVVLEPPSTANGFGRLVLRNDARACDMIVIEWKML